MSKNQVVSIMGAPTKMVTHRDKTIELIYEMNEWKGVVRGGVQTRRVSIVISPNDQVVLIEKNENCDKTSW